MPSTDLPLRSHLKMSAHRIINAVLAFRLMWQRPPTIQAVGDAVNAALNPH